MKSLSKSIQSSQQILNLNFLCQWHDPFTIKFSNQTGQYFVNWGSMFFLDVHRNFLPKRFGFSFDSPFYRLLDAWERQHIHQLLFVLQNQAPESHEIFSCKRRQLINNIRVRQCNKEENLLAS